MSASPESRHAISHSGVARIGDAEPGPCCEPHDTVTSGSASVMDAAAGTAAAISAANSRHTSLLHVLEMHTSDHYSCETLGDALPPVKSVGAQDPVAAFLNPGCSAPKPHHARAGRKVATHIFGNSDALR